jgi:hypothetical protein
VVAVHAAGDFNHVGRAEVFYSGQHRNQRALELHAGGRDEIGAASQVATRAVPLAQIESPWTSAEDGWRAMLVAPDAATHSAYLRLAGSINSVGGECPQLAHPARS